MPIRAPDRGVVPFASIADLLDRVGPEEEDDGFNLGNMLQLKQMMGQSNNRTISKPDLGGRSPEDVWGGIPDQSEDILATIMSVLRPNSLAARYQVHRRSTAPRGSR